jgi:hypothetical protein
MVGSTFIYIEFGQQRSLLNTTQSALANVDDVDINSKESRSLYHYFDLGRWEDICDENFPVFGGPSEYLFVTASDRDVVYDKVTAALAPSATTIISPDVLKKAVFRPDQ